MLLSHVKKITINTLLIVLFPFLIIIIILPFMAEKKFRIAEKAVAEYGWAEAEAKFAKAIQLNLLNSDYKVQFADFLYLRSKYNVQKDILIKRSCELYKSAIKLNPYNAEYWFNLGKIELWSVKNELLGYGTKNMIANFRNAVKNDSNGFNVSYKVGYAGIVVFKDLDPVDKEFILDRLEYVIKIKPYYSKYIYPKLWNNAKDINLLKRITPPQLDANRYLYEFLQGKELWQEADEQEREVDFYFKKEKPKEFEAAKSKAVGEIERIKGKALIAGRIKNTVAKEDWEGKDATGKFTYVDGNMYWKGTIYAPIKVPEGKLTLNIAACGTPAKGVYPYMVVRLDDEYLGGLYAGNEDMKDYIFDIDTKGGVKVLSVTFANDFAEKSEDRNLFIGEAGIE